MIPNPRRIHPRVNPQRHARAQRRVLWLMRGAGYLKREVGGLGAEPPPAERRGRRRAGDRDRAGGRGRATEGRVPSTADGRATRAGSISTRGDSPIRGTGHARKPALGTRRGAAGRLTARGGTAV